MRNRLLGYAIAGGILIGVSILSGYVAHSRGRGTGGAAINLDFVLKDVNGGDVRLSDFKGRPLVVNFWATWCGPCQLETPQLVELAAEYTPRGLAIVGISYDDPPDKVKAFGERFDVTYPLLIGLDRGDVFDSFGLADGLPTTVFIRADGTVARRLQGIKTKAWFQEQIEALLAD